MRRHTQRILWAALSGLFLSLFWIQPGSAAEANEATHTELRALRDGVTAAFNKLGASGREEDLEPLLQYVHKDVVLNAMNGVRAIGHNGIRQYFRQTMAGPNRTVQSVRHQFTADALSTLYGDDTAIAYGSTVGHYSLTGGMDFSVNAIWLCTMVKEGGKWQIAAFQFAPSIFDNPIAHGLERTMYWAAGIAGLVGIVLGVVLGRMSKRNKV
jgi:ketosteroid isomerase-like protein